ncbi:hypothetical protein SPF06_07115 [Sinomonas sp. JGH33]|uniref:Phage protein n=1 Tax=Sinomonas terricola TaxID=3110330 RepID=A0ABU5T494_9MICC|nr:hypothetical protein [Sinomonas sp. JGH33]MEA5454487.1 hypothetical protein [Sinomonas sp. JGH33]
MTKIKCTFNDTTIDLSYHDGPIGVHLLEDASINPRGDVTAEFDAEEVYKALNVVPRRDFDAAVSAAVTEALIVEQRAQAVPQESAIARIVEIVVNEDLEYETAAASYFAIEAIVKENFMPFRLPDILGTPFRAETRATGTTAYFTTLTGFTKPVYAAESAAEKRWYTGAEVMNLFTGHRFVDDGDE